MTAAPGRRAGSRRQHPTTGRLVPAVVAIMGVAGLLAGCAPPPMSRASGPSAASTGAPGSIDASAQNASCAPSLAGRSSRHSITVAGTQRSFIEHVPTTINAGGLRPIVLAFHGRGESAEQLERYSGLDTANVIVVYPQGLPGAREKPSWEATPFLDATAHDYEFAADIVAWAKQATCVDQTRIDLVGKSDGAGFAASAACSMHDVAAVATVSGAFYADHTRCSPHGSPVALLNMHGTADPVIAYAGTAQRGLISTDAWVSLWRSRDQCSGQPTTTGTPASLNQQTWSACADGTAVVNDQLIGGGHTWPGATVNSGPGPTSTAIDATQAILAFFANHPRRSP